MCEKNAFQLLWDERDVGTFISVQSSAQVDDFARYMGTIVRWDVEEKIHCKLGLLLCLRRNLRVIFCCVLFVFYLFNLFYYFFFFFLGGGNNNFMQIS